ncbi:hypothetical protein AB1Y20_011199 [Prymnesium parvum]|uniref:Transmembrane protein 53 n=1 Tax=Prymnesium parvum TaxID=97485 RepID=A0AB34IM66_PRYPA
MSLVTSGPSASRRTALLLGWTGGSMRHLRKYEALWHGFGFQTVAATSTFDMTFMPERCSAIRSVARQLMASVDSGRRPPSVVVPHVFSNGGALLMLTMLHEARRRRTLFDAAVFDSAPSAGADMQPIVAPYVVASSGLPAAERWRLLARLVPYSLLAQLAVPLVGVARPLGAIDELRDVRLNPPRPEVYIFSDEDALVPSARVESFAAHRAECGAAVELVRLKDSGHVAHFPAHPDKYTSAIEKLLARLETPH